MDILGSFAPGDYPLDNLKQQLLLLVSFSTIYLVKLIVYILTPLVWFALGSLSSVYLHVKPDIQAIFIESLPNTPEDVFFNILYALDAISTTLWSWPQLPPQEQAISMLTAVKLAYKTIRGHSISSKEATTILVWLPKTISRRMVFRECYGRSLSHVSGLTLFDLPLAAKVFLFKRSPGKDLDYLLARLPPSVSSFVKDEVCEEIYTRHATALATIVMFVGLTSFILLTFTLRNKIFSMIGYGVSSLWHSVLSPFKFLLGYFHKTQSVTIISKDATVQTETDFQTSQPRKTYLSQLMQTEDIPAPTEKIVLNTPNGDPQSAIDAVPDESEIADKNSVTGQVETNDVELATENVQSGTAAESVVMETQCSPPPALQKIQVYTARTRSHHMSKISAIAANASLSGNASAMFVPRASPQWSQLAWKSLLPVPSQQIAQNQNTGTHYLNLAANPSYVSPLEGFTQYGKDTGVTPTLPRHKFQCSPISSFGNGLDLDSSVGLSSLMGQPQTSEILYDSSWSQSVSPTYTSARQLSENNVAITSPNVESSHFRNDPRRVCRTTTGTVQHIDWQPLPLPRDTCTSQADNSDIVKSSVVEIINHTPSHEEQTEELQADDYNLEEPVRATITRHPIAANAELLSDTKLPAAIPDEEVFIYPGSPDGPGKEQAPEASISELVHSSTGYPSSENISENWHAATACLKDTAIDRVKGDCPVATSFPTKSANDGQPSSITQDPVNVKQTEFTFNLPVFPRASSVPAEDQPSRNLHSMLRSRSISCVPYSRCNPRMALKKPDVAESDLPESPDGICGKESPSHAESDASSDAPKPDERQGLEASIHTPKPCERQGLETSTHASKSYERQGLEVSIHTPKPHERPGSEASIHAPKCQGLEASIHARKPYERQGLEVSIHAPKIYERPELEASIHPPKPYERSGLQASTASLESLGALDSPEPCSRQGLEASIHAPKRQGLEASIHARKPYPTSVDALKLSDRLGPKVSMDASTSVGTSGLAASMHALNPDSEPSIPIGACMGTTKSKSGSKSNKKKKRH